VDNGTVCFFSVAFRRFMLECMNLTNLFDETEAANFLGITPRQVVRLANRGILPRVVYPGVKAIRFDPRDLAAWVESHKHPGISCGKEADPCESTMKD